MTDIFNKRVYFEINGTEVGCPSVQLIVEEYFKAQGNSNAQQYMESLRASLAENVHNEVTRECKQFQEFKEKWPDAYRAFRGAFDTPVARLKHNDEYSNDARQRIRELNNVLFPEVTSLHDQ